MKKYVAFIALIVLVAPQVSRAQQTSIQIPTCDRDRLTHLLASPDEAVRESAIESLYSAGLPASDAARIFVPLTLEPGHRPDGIAFRLALLDVLARYGASMRAE